MSSRNNKKITFFLIYLYHGGGERVVLDMAAGFLAAGWDVDFLLMEKKGPYVEQIPEGVRVIEIGTPKIRRSFLPLVKYLRKERPDAILSISKYTNLLSIWAKYLARVQTKVIIRLGIHLSALFKEYKSRDKVKLRDRLLPFLMKRFFPRADVLVGNSRGVALDLAGLLRVPSERVKVIYNPKDTAHIRELSEEVADHPFLRGDERAPVIIGMGRITKQKDFPTLIRAFAEVRGETPSKLIILGEGGRKDLSRLAAELGVADDLDLPGFVQNPYAYFARSDVFVLSSLWEGLPNAVIEAMACGLPVVSTDCPSGPRELLAPGTDINERASLMEEAEFGILTPVNNSHELAKALRSVIGNNALRDTYAKQSLKRAEDFEVKKIIAEYAELI